MLSDRCLSVCPVCEVGVLWPNGWMDQDETWHVGRPRPWPHCVDGDPPPLHKRAQPPNFGPYLLWQNGRMDQDATWRGGRPQPRELCVRWEPSPPFSSPKKAERSPPIFSPYLLRPNGCTDQYTTWYGSSLGPDDIVLDGDPAPPVQKGGGAPSPKRGSPIFGPCVLWPNGWMDEDGTWHGGGPWSRPHYARWGPSSPAQKGAEPPNLQPIFIVPKRL